RMRDLILQLSKSSIYSTKPRPWNKLADIRTFSTAFQRGRQKGSLPRFVTASADAQSRSEARSPLTKPA
ncbi:hypothetical protein ACA372_26200, partial [Klebsiella pneumoniae]